MWPSMLSKQSKEAFKLTIPSPQSATLAHYTKYSYSDLSECTTDLLNMYKVDFAAGQEKRFGAVWNKYSHAR